MNAREPREDRWAGRWSQLARGVGISPTEPVLLALSGGADSVYLLHLLARSEPRPRVLAVHVDHRLRGDESEGDALFCARLCGKLGVPFARREVGLDPDAPNLEARAREARYRVLADEATSAGLRTLLTGHHEDDALETLLLRWLRGSDLPGLAGLKSRNVIGGRHDAPVQVVRPLLTMRREEVRCLLRDAGLEWREDSSNDDRRFTRNRVRSGLLPEIERSCGPDGVEGLRAFAGAVERLEEELAGRTAHLAWSPPAHAPAVRSEADGHQGGYLPRAELRDLATPLLRRALWRLLSEGTGHPPSRALLAILEDDLADDRTTRRALPGGWTLHLRRDGLLLTPPGRGTVSHPAPAERAGGDTGPDRPDLEGGDRDVLASDRSVRARSSSRPQPAPEGGPPREGLRLDLPGRVRLPDGRVLVAEFVSVEPGAPVPTDDATRVELDAEGLTGPLTARSIRSGDRFHPLGAPGSRPLGRFLRDVGVPAEERALVPLVFHGDELIWVGGLRPCEARRVRPGTVRRLRLRLLHAARV